MPCITFSRDLSTRVLLVSLMQDELLANRYRVSPGRHTTSRPSGMGHFWPSYDTVKESVGMLKFSEGKSRMWQLRRVLRELKGLAGEKYIMPVHDIVEAPSPEVSWSSFWFASMDQFITMEMYGIYRRPLKAKEVLQVMQDTLAGIGALHSMGYVHANMSPASIARVEVERGQFTHRIIDVEYSVPYKSIMEHPNRLLHYCAPETANDMVKYGHCSAMYSQDIFSLGQSYLWLSSRNLPPRQCSYQDALRDIADSKKPMDIPTTLFRDKVGIRDVIVGCLEKKVKKRPGLSDLRKQLSDISQKAGSFHPDKLGK